MTMAEARIFADLKNDHDRQRKLMDKVSAADPEERGELFEELRQELQAHAAAEEESLYATMLAKPDLREDARHSVAEHKEVDDLLAELVDLDPEDEEWGDKYGELKHRYTHHIDEEEEEMFPAASEGLSSAEEQDLAQVLERRKPRELARAAEETPGDERE
jgi:hemerythrin superfamily protein